ncbi:MAG: HlyD family efflux transporter periplasmic adaptor subunit [Bacillota bacterium]
MTKHRPGIKGITRWIRAAVVLVVLAAVGLVGWIYLTPLLTADSITLYDSYTVKTGDIQTTLSFSATLDVKKSQTYTASELSRVKELYVKSGDEVKEDDPLMLLSNGELLTAGFSGVINEIRVKVGDWVRPNFSAAQVCDLQNLQVTMNVDEYDVKALTVGQPCTVTVISLGIDFETAIAHINRVSSSSGTLAYYTVTCDLTVPPEVLPGMRATVSIPSLSAEGVSALPLQALAFDENDSPYTLIKIADAYEKRTVETGLSDGMLVEIKSGVRAGDTVYAVSGTQSAQAGISFEELYRMIAGEKVVIHETSAQQFGDRQIPTDFAGQFPQGVQTEGAQDSTTTFADMPQPDTGTAP